MSEHENESRWMGPFVLGFVLGVLVCLGVGGSLVAMMYSRARMEAEQARQAEMEVRELVEQQRRQAMQAEQDARRAAEVARREADRQRQAAVENEAKANKAIEKVKERKGEE